MSLYPFSQKGHLTLNLPLPSQLGQILSDIMMCVLLVGVFVQGVILMSPPEYVTPAAVIFKR